LTDKHDGALGVSKHPAAVRPWRLIAANKIEMCSRMASAQVETSVANGEAVYRGAAAETDCSKSSDEKRQQSGHHKASQKH
jgi:hypothetical protein